MKKSVFSIGALSAICFLCDANLHAQFTAGHIALSSDNTSVTSLPANTSSFLWSPGQGALRFGYFDSTSASAPIGQYSVAGGSNSSAKGNYALALGNHSTASGINSFAVNGGMASGFSSIAFEGNSLASGPAAIAMGAGSAATGDYSFALGGGTATGYASMALGQTTAAANSGTAVGSNNFGLEKDGITTPDPVNTSPNDPIFEVGNGDGVSNGPKHNGISNALTVYRDGTIRMYKACGGIAMGNFQ